MIRKLTEDDRRDVEQYVSKDKALNLFIIGDLEKYSFNESFLEYWGQYEQGKLTGILMRFYEFFTLYADEFVDVRGISKILLSYDVSSISGGKRFIDQLANYMKDYKRKDSYYAKLDSALKLMTCDGVVKTPYEDIEKVLKLIDAIEEFSGSDSLERKQLAYKEGTKTGYHIEIGDEIVSSAETAAENSCSAMIVSVATHKEHRKKGYGSKVVSKLCMDKLNEGKTLCLFYDNPAAGKIYKRLGFKDIDMWSSLIF